MSNVISSIGVEFYVGYSNNKNTYPTWEQCQKLPNIIECSELDMKPDAVATKSYDNLGYMYYAPEQIDTGGVHSLTANMSKKRESEKIWNQMVEKYNNGDFIWLCIFIPHIDESTYIPICPIKVGLFNLKQQSTITQNLYYTIVGQVKFGELLKTHWGKSWNTLGTINGGQQLTSDNEIDIDDVNKLFNNLFFLKGN